MFSELKDKEQILKEISPDLGISFDCIYDEYLIVHKGFPFQRVGVDGFTRELVNDIKKIVWLNENGNVMDEIEKNNSKLEVDRENKATEINYQMAKDIRKPLLKEIYGV
jgi:hypothetical protein